MPAKPIKEFKDQPRSLPTKASPDSGDLGLGKGALDIGGPPPVAAQPTAVQPPVDKEKAKEDRKRQINVFQTLINHLSTAQTSLQSAANLIGEAKVDIIPDDISDETLKKIEETARFLQDMIVRADRIKTRLEIAPSEEFIDAIDKVLFEGLDPKKPQTSKPKTLVWQPEKTADGKPGYPMMGGNAAKSYKASILKPSK